LPVRQYAVLLLDLTSYPSLFTLQIIALIFTG
jgi:hypothetical protein